MELVTLRDIPEGAKTFLLSQLGLEVDQEGFVTRNGKRVVDKYIEQPVQMSNMAIFPGSTLVLDDNPLSIASYIEEYGEV